MFVLSREEMQLIDSLAINKYYIPSIILMENAARATRQEIEKNYKANSNITIFSGMGNNGGDGLALARQLIHKNYKVKIFMVGDINKATDLTMLHYNSLNSLSADISFINKEIKEEEAKEIYSSLLASQLVVDAIFGVSCNRVISGYYKSLIEIINKSGQDVLSIDIASGVDANSGQIWGVAINAKLTVAMALPKIGHLLYPGAAHTGKMLVADIGIPEQALYSLENPKEIITEGNSSNFMERKDNSHKGTYGNLLIIASSRAMAGAAVLSAKAAYKSGLGIVYVLTSEENRDIILTNLPEAIVYTYSINDKEKKIKHNFSKLESMVDSILIGPGMTINYPTSLLLDLSIATDKILTIDADALNVLSLDQLNRIKKREAYTLATPHIGEMARILKKIDLEALNEYTRTYENTQDKEDVYKKYILDNLFQVAEFFATEYNLILILKSARTIVSFEDAISYINILGNNGMATAGSGDVLAGIIGANMALAHKLIENEDKKLIADEIIKQATLNAVYKHSKAGDVILYQTGYDAMTASDIIRGLSLI